eukprot:8696844-Lingulodinium_polyedra.AAC.1
MPHRAVQGLRWSVSRARASRCSATCCVMIVCKSSAARVRVPKVARARAFATGKVWARIGARARAVKGHNQQRRYAG